MSVDAVHIYLFITCSFGGLHVLQAAHFSILVCACMLAWHLTQHTFTHKTHTHTHTHTRQVVQAVKDSQGQTMTFVIQRAGAEPDDLEVVKQ